MLLSTSQIGTGFLKMYLPAFKLPLALASFAKSLNAKADLTTPRLANMLAISESVCPSGTTINSPVGNKKGVEKEYNTITVKNKTVSILGLMKLLFRQLQWRFKSFRFYPFNPSANACPR